MAIALLAACGAVGSEALAQGKSPTDQARKLGQEAWQALDANNYKEALDKANEAEALYHAPTHLLMIGHAQVGLGRLAEALATYERLAAEPLPDSGPPAFKEAQEKGRKRMKELLARVPSLLVAVEGADGATPVVTVDAKVIDFASGLAVRLDPGEHAITVATPGFETVKRTVTLPEKGGVVRLPIAVEKVGVAAARASASASAAAAASGAPTAAPTSTDAAPSRTPAYVAFGVAGAGLIAGAITGAISLGMAGDLKKRCPGDVCSPDDRGSLDTANLLAHTSTATFVLGGVAAAAGIVLISIDLGPSPKPATAGTALTRRQSRPHVEPWISFGGAGLRGAF